MWGRKKLYLIVLASLLIWPMLVLASGQSWSTAKAISQSSFVDTAVLSNTGSVVYYRYTVAGATPLSISLAVPRSAAERFVPRLALFSPSEFTAGPELPIEQPPQTIAAIYPGTTRSTIFDPATQAMYNQTIALNITLPTAGTYILAVYNAGTVSGEYRLSIQRGVIRMASWADAWTMPMQWWRDQSFAGFGWLTLITPIVILLAGYLVYLRLDHHQLHVHKTYASKTPPQRKPKPKSSTRITTKTTAKKLVTKKKSITRRKRP